MSSILQLPFALGNAVGPAAASALFEKVGFQLATFSVIGFSLVVVSLKLSLCLATMNSEDVSNCLSFFSIDNIRCFTTCLQATNRWNPPANRVDLVALFSMKFNESHHFVP